MQPEYATCAPLRVPCGLNDATCNNRTQHATFTCNMQRLLLVAALSRSGMAAVGSGAAKPLRGTLPATDRCVHEGAQKPRGQGGEGGGGGRVGGVIDGGTTQKEQLAVDELAGVCEGDAVRRSGRCHAPISTTCNAHHGRCNMQHATRIARRRCHAQRAAISATCNYNTRRTSRAAYNSPVKHATRIRDMRPATCTMRPKRCNMQQPHATCNMQRLHATCNAL
jgi:hypothetical protein